MKYVLFGAAGIAALVMLVVAIGYSLPVKHRATGEATFRASPETLFHLVTDVDAFPVWRSGVKTAETLPSTDGRRRFRETSGDGTISYVVESAEVNRRMVARIDDKSLPFGGSWTYELVPAGDGRTTLRITEDGEVYNPIFRFLSRFLFGHDTTIRKYLADVGRRFPG
jgi:hypothetical protein